MNRSPCYNERANNRCFYKINHQRLMLRKLFEAVVEGLNPSKLYDRELRRQYNMAARYLRNVKRLDRVSAVSPKQIQQELRIRTLLDAEGLMIARELYKNPSFYEFMKVFMFQWKDDRDRPLFRSVMLDDMWTYCDDFMGRLCYSRDTSSFLLADSRGHKNAETDIQEFFEASPSEVEGCTGGEDGCSRFVVTTKGVTMRRRIVEDLGGVGKLPTKRTWRHAPTVDGVEAKLVNDILGHDRNILAELLKGALKEVRALYLPPDKTVEDIMDLPQEFFDSHDFSQNFSIGTVPIVSDDEEDEVGIEYVSQHEYQRMRDSREIPDDISYYELSQLENFDEDEYDRLGHDAYVEMMQTDDSEHDGSDEKFRLHREPSSAPPAYIPCHPKDLSGLSKIFLKEELKPFYIVDEDGRRIYYETLITSIIKNHVNEKGTMDELELDIDRFHNTLNTLLQDSTPNPEHDENMKMRYLQTTAVLRAFSRLNVWMQKSFLELYDKPAYTVYDCITWSKDMYHYFRERGELAMDDEEGEWASSRLAVNELFVALVGQMKQRKTLPLLYKILKRTYGAKDLARFELEWIQGRASWMTNCKDNVLRLYLREAKYAYSLHTGSIGKPRTFPVYFCIDPAHDTGSRTSLAHFCVGCSVKKAQAALKAERIRMLAD